MNTVTVDVHELQRPGRLGELLTLAAGGAEVLIRDGAATGKLVAGPPEPPPGAKREWVFGLHAGEMVMREDFDDYIDEEDFLKGNF